MDYIGNLFEVKNSYFISIIIVVIIIFTTVFIWHKIESFVEEVAKGKNKYEVVLKYALDLYKEKFEKIRGSKRY